MSCVVEIEHLTFSYPDGHPALSDVTLNLAHGEKVALVGPNGAGKSTLLLHLNGILPRQSGELRVSELDVSGKNLGRVRALVGLVFQQPDDQLFSPTVFDDVAFGPIYQGLPQSEITQRVTEALEQVGMRDYIDRVSHHLSVGEKKRIAVLVLDEPTAGLDPRARRTLIELLRQLPQTMIVATHDLPMVRELLPPPLVMDHAQVPATGPTAGILSDPRLLTAHGLEM